MTSEVENKTQPEIVLHQTSIASIAYQSLGDDSDIEIVNEFEAQMAILFDRLRGRFPGRLTQCQVIQQIFTGVREY